MFLKEWEPQKLWNLLNILHVSVMLWVWSIVSRLLMKKLGNCRLWLTRRCRPWTAVRMRSTGEAHWRRPKPRNCCWSRVCRLHASLFSIESGMLLHISHFHSCHLSFFSAAVVGHSLVFKIRNQSKLTVWYPQLSILCWYVIIFIYFVFLAFMIYFLFQVRSALPCWLRWPDWRRRGAQNLERQQWRTVNLFPSSPAEALSASQTSSCRSRWNMSAPHTTVQVPQLRRFLPLFGF